MQPIIANPRASLLVGLGLAAAVLLVWLMIAGADAFGLFSFLVRLLHVLAAMVWIGLVFFVNFVQLVALQSADEQGREILAQGHRSQCRLVVPACLDADGGERRGPAGDDRLPPADR